MIVWAFRLEYAKAPQLLERSTCSEQVPPAEATEASLY